MNNSIICIGGCDENVCNQYNKITEYDLSKNIWDFWSLEDQSELGFELSGHSSNLITLNKEEKIFVFGGYDNWKQEFTAQSYLINIKMKNYEKINYIKKNNEIKNELPLPRTYHTSNYDIRNNKKNTYFIINFTENLLINFLIIFSAIVLVTAIVIGVGWNYLEKKVGPNYVFAYHDKIKYILCAHIFLSLALIFKTISVMRTENYELTVAVEISLYLSVSFFRSLLWFLIYLISFGWNICFQDLAMSEQRKIFRLFIFIAIFYFSIFIN